MKPIKLNLGTVHIPYEEWEALRKRYDRETIRSFIIQEGLAQLAAQALDFMDDDEGIPLDYRSNADMREIWKNK